MITASDILEAYYSSFQSERAYTEIFENPSRSETLTLLRTSKIRNIRFFADAKTRTVYAWDSDAAIHLEVWRHLGLWKTAGISLVPLKNGACSHVLEGIAHREGSKCVMFASHALQIVVDVLQDKTAPRNEKEQCQAYLEDFLSYDWSWVDKYIVATPYLNSLRLREVLK
jgi:hypothetical protein